EEGVIDMGAYETAFLSQAINPIADIAKTYGDAAFEPGGTASSGLEVRYSSSDNSIAEAYQDAADGDTWKIRIKKVGTVTITASQPGNGEYSAAPDVEFDLTVDAKPVMISLTTAPVAKVYDGTADGSITPSNLRFAAGDIVNGDDLYITLGSNAISYDTKDRKSTR